MPGGILEKSKLAGNGGGGGRPWLDPMIGGGGGGGGGGGIFPSANMAANWLGSMVPIPVGNTGGGGRLPIPRGSFGAPTPAAPLLGLRPGIIRPGIPGKTGCLAGIF